MNKYLKLTLCIVTTLSVGAISGFATANSIKDWYIYLNKPSFNPPNFLFGPVWICLYILMGLSLFKILQSPTVKQRKVALQLFFIQLFLNFCWSFLFFNFNLLGVSFIEIVILWLCIIAMIYNFYKINKTAAYLQIPYLLWVSFASILNGAIWYLN